MFLLADTWSRVGSVSSAIAALAALATVALAAWTLAVERKARAADALAHREQMDAEQEHLDATRRGHVATAEAYRDLLASAEASHREQMAERERAAHADLMQRRLAQMQTVADLLGAISDTARHEWAHGVPVVGPEVQPLRLSRMPTLLIRLKAALGLLDAIGGPRLPKAEELGDHPHRANDPLGPVLGLAGSALSELEFVMRPDQPLRAGRERGAPA
jgi:hypothetical protein